MSRCFALFLLLLIGPSLGAEPRARNVILFLGDAGGIATLHAATFTATTSRGGCSSRTCRTSPSPRPPLTQSG